MYRVTTLKWNTAKLATNRKSTIFLQTPWNLGKIIFLRDGYIDQVSWWLEKNCGFSNSSQFCRVSHFKVVTLYMFTNKNKTLKSLTIVPAIPFLAAPIFCRTFVVGFCLKRPQNSLVKGFFQRTCWSSWREVEGENPPSAHLCRNSWVRWAIRLPLIP